jgi:A/G-specific adenine glycosylase
MRARAATTTAAPAVGPAQTLRRRRRRRAPRLDPVRVRRFRDALLRWYARHGRDLPWRRTRDAYAILVSEVMLQQTQVGRVLDYYPRFLARYPTVEELARASESEVRDAWQGLGYYRRAANLQTAARLVVDRHGGRFPADVPSLIRLPGIGRYTAGAVASFAFDVDAPIVDTNAGRVLARVFDGRRRPAAPARLWALAEIATPPGRAYAFNQAIMDLGAMVCSARRPACGGCPVRRACRRFRAPRAARRQYAASGRVSGSAFAG